MLLVRYLKPLHSVSIVWKSKPGGSKVTVEKTEPIEEGGTTCEEGLHARAVRQLDRSVPGVGGQRRVGAVVQEQPDDRQVIARHRVVKGPEERAKRHGLITVHFIQTNNGSLVCVFPDAFVGETPLTTETADTSYYRVKSNGM